VYIVAKFYTGFNTLIAYLQKRQQNEPQRLTFYLLNAIIANGMWEYARSTSHRQTSMRRVLIYFIAAIAAAFLWVLIISPTTYAADATWSSTSAISYNSNDYRGPANEATTKSLGLTKGAQAYTYVDPAPTEVSTTSTVRKIHVIYFTSADTVDVATSAKYKTYIYQGPISFKDPSAPVNIAIDKQANAPNAGTTSCSVSAGMGWMICPVTGWIATGMDWVFGVLSGFLNVKPVANNPDTALFRAWTYMRSFANVAFVIAFLIIIYSQLTNFGISNYGIKKLLPRLIIAALLVNLSYYICAIAVDISNILGYSIQDVFIGMRNSLVGVSDKGWTAGSWTDITAFILSGGTAATVGSIGLVTTLSTYGVAGSLFLLLPALISGLFSVLVALLIMAARQAIVTILIIISPLAFVAYLLPNTEKWYEKWQSTFMTMLILFPAFSIVYGGAQLASASIIQNADSINLVILGMIVQVVPLMITPLLIKLSGSTLGKIASFASGMNKGVLDQTRKFTEDRTGNIAAKRLAETAKRGQFLRHNAQRRDNNRQRRETRRKIHEGMSENRFKASKKYTPLHQMAYSADTEKQRVEQTLDRDLKTRIRTTPSLLAKEMEVRVLTDEAANEKARVEKIHEDLRAGKDSSASASLTALLERSETATREIAINAIASQTAKRVQQNNLSKALLENSAATMIDGRTIRDYAGGIDTDNGSDSALAYAVNVQREAGGKLIAERTSLIKHFKLDGAQRQIIAMGSNVTSTDIDGHSYEFSAADDNTREAAIDLQLKIGSYADIESIIAESGRGQNAYKFRTTISDAIASYGIANKGSFFGGRFINEVGLGNISGEAGLNWGAEESILGGKFKPEDLANNDAGALLRYLEVARTMPARITDPDKQIKYLANVQELKETAATILSPDTDLDRHTSKESKDALIRIRDEL